MNSGMQPTRDIVNIEGDIVAGSQIVLRTIGGAVVRMKVATGVGRERLPVTDLASGVYVLEMQTRGGRAFERVIVSR